VEKSIATVTVNNSVNQVRVRMSPNHLLSAAITHFSGRNIGSQHSAVYSGKESIEEKKSSIVQNHKWNDAYTCIDFIVRKKKCWTRILQSTACFIQPYLAIEIWPQDISQNVWSHSILLIKISQRHSLKQL